MSPEQHEASRILTAAIESFMDTHQEGVASSNLGCIRSFDAVVLGKTIATLTVGVMADKVNGPDALLKTRESQGPLGSICATCCDGLWLVGETPVTVEQSALIQSYLNNAHVVALNDSVLA